MRPSNPSYGYKADKRKAISAPLRLPMLLLRTFLTPPQISFFLGNLLLNCGQAIYQAICDSNQVVFFWAMPQFLAYAFN
jgi:hypothetical protein